MNVVVRESGESVSRSVMMDVNLIYFVIYLVVFQTKLKEASFFFISLEPCWKSLASCHFCNCDAIE